MRQIILLSLLILAGNLGSLVDGVALEIDLRLTPEEKKVMDKFKKIMRPKVPHKYMQEEIYLVRWLRAKNFDLKKAEEMLMQNLRWRKQHKMDMIHQEDWRDIQQEFPHYIDGYDKRGQPIIRALAREIDIRNAVVTGRIRRVLRYLDKAMDDAQGQLREMQLEGKNVTQFVFIMHLGAFNIFQHGCPRCITSILEFVTSYENHFPGMADKILLVATPPTFEPIANLVRETMSPFTREAMKIYGTEPKVWKKALLDIIDPDQLPVEFGGTRPDKPKRVI